MKIRTLSLMALLSFAGNIWAEKPIVKKPIIVKSGSVAPVGSPWATLVQNIRKRVEKETEGALKFKVYFGSLGGEKKLIEDVKRGHLQLTGVSVGAMAAQYAPELSVFELPFMFGSNEEVDYVLKKTRSVVSDILKKRGFVFAMWSENGWHGYASKKGCIQKPSDMKGLRMRSQDSQWHIETYKAFGATPQEKSVPEVLGALNVGNIDGFSQTPLFSFATQWYQSISHFTYSKHIYQPALMVFSKKWFDGLSPKIQKILLSSKEEKQGFKMVRMLNDPILENMKAANVELCSFDEKNRESFMPQARKVWKKFENKSVVNKKMLQLVVAAKNEFAASKQKKIVANKS